MVPIIAASFSLMTADGVSLAFVCDRVVHHVFFALPKLKNTSLDECLGLMNVLAATACYALANISARKGSPVVMTAQMILASLLASATVTRRAGFLASRATIQSRNAPLRLPTTRNNEVAPTTSS